MRLSSATLATLPAGIARPAYDRDSQQAGIVHLGIGAFHRAHQAWYTDAAMNRGERDWAITGVSLRSPGVAQQINPQDGLYTLAERSARGSALRIIGSVQRVLVAGENPDAAIDALAAPDTHIISLTVTEKGYCRDDRGGLDHALAQAGSIYPLLAQAFVRRHAAGLPGVTLLSCDNLADNGRRMHALMSEYLDRHMPGLLPWFAAECTCPSTMIDRIVPATSDADRANIAARLGGLEDAACVVTEPFSQWVIEDRFAGPRPGWELVGAELVHDVRSYETAKLRMLNGAHSMLAYCGLAREHRYVHEAIADPVLRAAALRLMLEEALPSIATAPGQDLAGYAHALIARFANPALNHRLIQIAMDGSQKIPQRWLETLAFHAADDRHCPAILAGIAAWIDHVQGRNVTRWGAVDDPLAGRLATLAGTTDRAAAATAIFGGNGPLAGTWTPNAHDLAAIAAA